MHPSMEELRELVGWQPPLGVVSVYLGFQPEDRSGAWRTHLRNGLEKIREQAGGAEHERRVALRATADRILARFEDGELRPPPRGEACMMEVAEKEGAVRSWPTGVEPAEMAVVEVRERPLIAPLVDLTQRGAPHGIAVISAERVRLLVFAEAQLEQLEDWELSVFSLDWRERKSASPADPSREQGVSSSGHDQYEERLEHNRERFLAETGRLAGARLRGRGIEDVLVFGSPEYWREFADGTGPSGLSAELADRNDLISAPIGRLLPEVAEAVERARMERDRTVVERALGEASGTRPGALGPQETAEALRERRVEHLVFDAAKCGEAEELVRGAVEGNAAITIVRGELAELLDRCDGVAAVLRY
jgi:Bacterial archaeo-eukaryotic release factor family 10